MKEKYTIHNLEELEKSGCGDSACGDCDSDDKKMIGGCGEGCGCSDGVDYEDDCCGGGCDDCLMEGGYPYAKIGKRVRDMEFETLYKGQIVDMNMMDNYGKWQVIVFYPADFTFVCPTELVELSSMYDKFQAIDTEIIAVSTDSVHAHKAWREINKDIAAIEYPMASDSNHEMSEYFDVLIKEEGRSLRGTFIIDPEGTLIASEINDNSIGRSAKELYRKLQAAQFVYEHGDQVCPASWEPGEDAITL